MTSDLRLFARIARASREKGWCDMVEDTRSASNKSIQHVLAEMKPDLVEFRPDKEVLRTRLRDRQLVMVKLAWGITFVHLESPNENVEDGWGYPFRARLIIKSLWLRITNINEDADGEMQVEAICVDLPGPRASDYPRDQLFKLIIRPTGFTRYARLGKP